MKTSFEMVKFLIIIFCAAAFAVALSGCSVDTTRPDYTPRLYESRDTIDRKHEAWRDRQINRRQRQHDMRVHRDMQRGTRWGY